MMTKKLARSESQFTLRRLLARALTRFPAMSKVSSSPSEMPSRSAMPCSIDSSAASGANQRPATIGLCVGALSA